MNFQRSAAKSKHVLKHTCARINKNGKQQKITVKEAEKISSTPSGKSHLKALIPQDALGNDLVFRDCSKTENRRSHFSIKTNGGGSGGVRTNYNPKLSQVHITAQQHILDYIQSFDIYVLCKKNPKHTITQFTGQKTDKVTLENHYINNHGNNIIVDAQIEQSGKAPWVFEVLNTHKTERESRECRGFIYGGEIIAGHIIEQVKQFETCLTCEGTRTPNHWISRRISLNAFDSNIECTFCDKEKAEEAIQLAGEAEALRHAVDKEKAVEAIQLAREALRRAVDKERAEEAIQLAREALRRAVDKERAEEAIQLEREAEALRHVVDKEKAKVAIQLAREAEALRHLKEREARRRERDVSWIERKLKKLKPLEIPKAKQITAQDIDNLSMDARSNTVEFIKAFCDWEEYERKVRDGRFPSDAINNWNTDSGIISNFIFGRFFFKKLTIGDAKYRIQLKKLIASGKSDDIVNLNTRRANILDHHA